MSGKYIIRNCPCFSPTCTNCVIKQIVELCEQYKKDYNTTHGVWLLANNITNLLDIQECK